jgi:hypothetical protein
MKNERIGRLDDWTIWRFAGLAICRLDDGISDMGFWNVEPRNPGTQEPRNPGTWNAGTQEPRNPGTQEPRNLERWNPGAWNPEPGNPGTQEPRNPEPGTRNAGTLEQQDHRTLLITNDVKPCNDAT